MTEFHPRWYRQRVSTWWWLGSWRYLAFILRELSSLAVAWFVILTLAQLWALSNGPIAYQAFQELLAMPLLLAVNGVALALVVYHAVTWFNLAPRAMVVRLGGRRVPDLLIAGANYAAWIAASLAVGWFLVSK